MSDPTLIDIDFKNTMAWVWSPLYGPCIMGSMDYIHYMIHMMVYKTVFAILICSKTDRVD